MYSVKFLQNVQEVQGEALTVERLYSLGDITRAFTTASHRQLIQN